MNDDENRHLCDHFELLYKQVTVLNYDKRDRNVIAIHRLQETHLLLDTSRERSMGCKRKNNKDTKDD